MEVQSQVSINKDEMILLFVRLRTSKICLKAFSSADMVKTIFFAWPVESVAPC